MSDAKARALPRLVPREQVRHWQRWQAAELGDGRAPAQKPPEAAKPSPEQLAAQAEADRQAAQERERRAQREAAEAEGRKSGHAEGLAAGRQEGHTLGRQQGYDEGYAAGLAKGQQEAHAQAMALATLLQQSHDTLAQLESNVPDALARLALSIAAKVVGRELQTRPDAIVALIQELLHQEPVSDGIVKLHLHPEDATLVSAQLGPALADHAWRLVPDDTLTRGGCRLLTPLGELDATLQTRWQRTCAAAGLESPWTQG